MSATRASSRWVPVVNAAGVIAGSFFAADTVNAVVSANLWAAAVPVERRWSDGGTASGEERARPSVEDYLGPIVTRNVFANGAPDPDAGAPVTDAGAPAVAGTCTLPLTVLSVVVVRNDPSLSLVTFLDRAVTPPAIDVRQIGEEAPGGARFAAVTLVDAADGLGEDAVVELVRADGVVERCVSSETGTAPGPGAHVPGMVAMASSADAGIRKVDDTHYEVDKARIDAMLGNGMADLANEVRIVPHVEGGQAKGYKLATVKPGSTLTKIGLASGDVLRKVNGYDVTNPGEAMQVFALLKNERNVSIDLTRGGRNTTLSYAIR